MSEQKYVTISLFLVLMSEPAAIAWDLQDSSNYLSGNTILIQEKMKQVLHHMPEKSFIPLYEIPAAAAMASTASTALFSIL